MPEPKRPLKVFLCHAHADRDSVRGLYTRLTKDGVDAWLDKAKLLPGQDWELEIRKAVREADVVVVCLSKQFNQAGFRQKEVRLALDTAMEKPEGEIFIIPARLEECDNLESLRKWHWVDLFEDDGYEMLMRALRIRADKIGATLQLKKGWLPKVNTQPAVIKKPSPPVEKPKKEIQTSKIFNRNIIGIIGFVMLILASVFSLPSLIEKPEATPVATSTNRLENITSTFENTTSFTSFPPTQSQAPASTPPFTATIEPRSVNWEDAQINLSGQSISENNITDLRELAKLQTSITGSQAVDLTFLNENKLFMYETGTVIYLRKIDDGSIVRTYNPTESACFDLSTDEKLLVTLSKGELRVWNVDDGSLVTKFQSQGNYYGNEMDCPIRFSQDNSLLATSNGKDDTGTRSINIWQFPDLTLTKTITSPNFNQEYPGYRNNLYSPTFSPDGTLLAGYGQDAIYIWDTKNWTLTFTLHDAGYYFAFSPDNSLIASLNDETVSIWRTIDGTLIQTLKDTSSNFGFYLPIFFLPNNNILVTGFSKLGKWDDVRSFRLWQISSGKQIYDVKLGDEIRSGAISSDGTTLLFSTSTFTSTSFVRLFGIVP